jgi:hypothetical protein
MKKRLAMMVLVIAVAIALVGGNLYHLRFALSPHMPVQNGTVSKKSPGVDIQVGLMPGILIRIY